MNIAAIPDAGDRFAAALVTIVPKGSIYGNFENKDEVALAAFDHNRGCVHSRIWLRSWGVGCVLAIPAILIIGPRIQGLVERLIPQGEGSSRQIQGVNESVGIGVVRVLQYCVGERVARQPESLVSGFHWAFGCANAGIVLTRIVQRAVRIHAPEPVDIGLEAEQVGFGTGFGLRIGWKLSRTGGNGKRNACSPHADLLHGQFCREIDNRLVDRGQNPSVVCAPAHA